MCQEGIEIEAFVYGAVCIAYSGQCLMSSSLKNRSANRGACAQNCRLKYHKDGVCSKDGFYTLSPKDLNAIELVPNLIEAGVASLKIEGRMKNPAYVYTVTKAFREAIDAYYEGRSYHLSKERETELLKLFNRGFSKGHLAHSSVMERMAHDRPNHQGIHLGKVKAVHGHYIEVALQEELKQGDGIRILSQPKDIGFIVNKMENKRGLLINLAKKKEVVQIYCPEGWPKVKDEVRLTSDIRLLEKVSSMIKKHQRRIPISIHLIGKVGHPLRILIQDEKHEFQLETDMRCQRVLKQPLGEERLKEAFLQLTDSAYRLDHFSCTLESIFLPMKEIHQLRRTMLKKLDEVRSIFHKRKGDESLEGPSFHQNQVLNEMGDLYGERKCCIAGMPLNISNSYAIAYFLSLTGIKAVILSSELSSIQIREAIRHFERRYGFTPFTYQFVFGKRDLMIIKQGFDEKKIRQLNDLQDNRYDLSYTNEQVIVHEPKNFHAQNQYAQGSYLIVNESLDNVNKILEDAYEELYERI